MTMKMQQIENMTKCVQYICAKTLKFNAKINVSQKTTTACTECPNTHHISANNRESIS